jgi:hypothetical protein
MENIGKHQILEKLGRGSIRIVYQARDPDRVAWYDHNSGGLNFRLLILGKVLEGIFGENTDFLPGHPK